MSFCVFNFSVFYYRFVGNIRAPTKGWNPLMELDYYYYLYTSASAIVPHVIVAMA